MIKFLKLIEQQPAGGPVANQTDQEAQKADTAEIQKLEKVLMGPMKNYLARVNRPEELERLLDFMLDNMNDQLKKNSKIRPIMMAFIKKF